MKPNPSVRCPTCRKVGRWFDGPFGPFCSRRCKLVDLGKWLNEENLISDPLRPEHFDGYDQLRSETDLDKPEEGPAGTGT